VLGHATNGTVEKAKWISEMKSFSDEYFSGDLKKTTYLLKDISNCDLWGKLQATYKHVDYTEIVEEEDNTKILETIACAGGHCEF